MFRCVFTKPVKVGILSGVLGLGSVASAQTQSDGSYRVFNPVDQSNGELNRRVPQLRQGDGNFGSSRDGGSRRHTGIDIVAAEGAPIRATTGGVVIQSIRNDGNGAGSRVTILHPDGYTSHYWHLQADNLPARGTPVRAGEVIGRVGRTGNVPLLAQTHLHFQIQDPQGRPVPPQLAPASETASFASRPRERSPMSFEEFRRQNLPENSNRRRNAPVRPQQRQQPTEPNYFPDDPNSVAENTNETANNRSWVNRFAYAIYDAMIPSAAAQSRSPMGHAPAGETSEQVTPNSPAQVSPESDAQTQAPEVPEQYFETDGQQPSDSATRRHIPPSEQIEVSPMPGGSLELPRPQPTAIPSTHEAHDSSADRPSGLSQEEFRAQVDAQMGRFREANDQLQQDRSRLPVNSGDNQGSRFEYDNSPEHPIRSSTVDESSQARTRSSGDQYAPRDGYDEQGNRINSDRPRYDEQGYRLPSAQTGQSETANRSWAESPANLGTQSTIVTQPLPRQNRVSNPYTNESRPIGSSSAPSRVTQMNNNIRTQSNQQIARQPSGRVNALASPQVPFPSAAPVGTVSSERPNMVYNPYTGGSDSIGSGSSVMQPGGTQPAARFDYQASGSRQPSVSTVGQTPTVPSVTLPNPTIQQRTPGSQSNTASARFTR